jgi:MerR family transcriptional regulator/heat shock protein HspR
MEISREEPIYSISTAAKLLGISVPTLRVYEKEGLIIPHKTKGNQRNYSQADLERVECIRRAINERKISVNGIKAIYSLIPCWEVVQCSDANRAICESYNSYEKPCWTIEHPKSICEERSCRDCEVYKNHSNCGKVKDLIKNISFNISGSN